MITISTEAMNAVAQSKLGRELDALWQSVIDYRDSTLNGVSYIPKARALRKFFESNIVSKLKEIVWKNVGLHFSEVFLEDMVSGGAGFCTIMYFDPKDANNYNGSIQIENIVNADYMIKSLPGANRIDTKVLTADQLMALADSFDKQTGGIKTPMQLEIRKLVRSKLGFDLEMAFLTEDRLAKNAGVANFTPREITAIVLHEIGHTLTLVEHAADCYARMSTFRYLEQAFKVANSDNIDEVARLADAVASRVESRGDKVNADRLRSVTKKLSNDVKNAGSTADQKAVRKLIGGLIDSVFCLFADVLVICADVIGGNQQSKRFGNDQKDKKSDLPINGRLVTWMERKSDEYAFSHGYGADQVGALHKLDAVLARYGKTEAQVRKINEAERLHKGLGLLASMRLLILAPLYASSYGYSLYPAGVKRLRELLNLSIQQLKANSTDAAAVAKYMKDCEYILKICDNQNSTEEAIAKNYKGYDIFMKYVSIPSFFDWIVHGRVMRELDELIDDVNAIGNNLLTYYGFKLQQLGK